MHLINYLKEFKRNFSLAGIINAFKNKSKIDSLKQVDVLYLCHDNSRPVLFQNVFFSPLIDSINYNLKDYSNYTIALPFSIKSGKSSFGNTINLNYYILIGLVKRVVKFRSLLLKQIENDPIVEVYSRILKKTKPKVIIGIQPSVEICVAAHRFNIEVFDVQHGIIDTKRKYSYYSSEKRKVNDKMCWPDYILTRNQSSFEKVKNEITNTDSILIGNLNTYFYHEIYKEGFDKRAVFKDNTRSVVLYTFQPLYPDSFAESNKMEGIIFPKILLEKIKEDKMNFLIKLHPSQIQHPTLFKQHSMAFLKIFEACSNVDFEVCNSYPLDNSLSYTNLHITFNSATIFDAVEYLIPSLVLDENEDRIESYLGDLLNLSIVKIDPKLEFIDKLKSAYFGDSKLQYESFFSFLKKIRQNLDGIQ